MIYSGHDGGNDMESFKREMSFPHGGSISPADLLEENGNNQYIIRNKRAIVSGVGFTYMCR